MGQPDYGAQMDPTLDPNALKELLKPKSPPTSQAFRRPQHYANIDVPRELEASAATYRERNPVYGDNWLHFGHVMAAMFPEGITLRTADEWNRMGVLVQCAAKFTRYAAQFANGGHEDSAHDLVVYAAMLQQLTKKTGEGA